MKLLGEVLSLSTQFLKDKKVVSPRLVAETLLSSVLNVKRMDLYLKFECPLEEKELDHFRALIKRAALKEPVEYILSQVEFYGIDVFVSPDTLIPRQETEILVDKVSSFLQKDELEGKCLLDLCSGSGCMGLSLKKKFPILSVYLSDFSKSALSLSQKTAEKNGVDVFFLQGDLLDPFRGKKADYVLCNPPYISEAEYRDLELSVKGFEPKSALVGGFTGLEFYERLNKDLPLHLNSKAKVFLEIGYLQGEAVSKIFSDPCWVRKELLQDWSGKDRFFFLEIE